MRDGGWKKPVLTQADGWKVAKQTARLRAVS